MSNGVTCALDSMPLNADWHWPADQDGRFVGQALVRPLFGEEPESGAIRADAALLAEPAEDGRIWRVRLDDSLRWSDGTALRAEHVLPALERIAARPRTAVSRFLAPGIDPARAVTGPATVEFRLRRPLSFGPALLTMPQFAPVRPEASLGDYRLDASDPDRILVRRHDFAHSHDDSPDWLAFTTLPGAATASPADLWAAIETGQADIVATSSVNPGPGPGAAPGQGQPGVGSAAGRDIAIFASLEFSGRLAELDPGSRHALGLVIDRRRVAGVCGGLARPFWRQTAPWLTPAEPTPEPAAEPPANSDADRLRRALGGQVEIGFARFAPNDRAVAEVCDQLTEALGVAARPRPLSYKQYVAAAIGGQLDLLYTLTVADFPHLGALLLPWRSDGAAAERAGFASPTLDRAIDEACRQPEDAPWHRADQLWLELMPRIPLLQARGFCLHGDRIGGAAMNSAGLLDFGPLTVRRVRAATR